MLIPLAQSSRDTQQARRTGGLSRSHPTPVRSGAHSCVIAVTNHGARLCDNRAGGGHPHRASDVQQRCVGAEARRLIVPARDTLTAKGQDDG